jgi:hypothetical protein
VRRLDQLRLTALTVLVGASFVWALADVQSRLMSDGGGTSPAQATAFVAVRTPVGANGSDRKLVLNSINTAPGKASGRTKVDLEVAVSNTGRKSFAVSAREFFLSAGGDFFGPPAPATAGLDGDVAPGNGRAGHLVFQVPTQALPDTTIVYKPKNSPDLLSLPLAAPPQPAVTLLAATSGNTIEDNFYRTNQTGWGASTNASGVANVTWGMDGGGASSFVTIANDTGSVGYQNQTNWIGIASAGATAFDGGDSLVEFSLSAVGHATPYTVQNACSDKSCYYGARLHTSMSRLEIARRFGGGTNVLATAPFVPSPNTLYWMRLDVSVGAQNTLQA